jgi:hypothetical protein
MHIDNTTIKTPNIDIYLNSSLTPEQSKEWIEFWNRSSHSHPRQHPFFAEAERAKGNRVIFVRVVHDRNLVLAGIFSVQSSFLGHYLSSEAVCLSGPVFDDIVFAREALPKILVYFRSRSVGRIRIRPNWRYPEALAVENLFSELGLKPLAESNPNWKTGLISLGKSEKELMASFTKNTRYYIGLAERLGIEIKAVTDTEEINIFSQELISMLKDRGCRASGNEHKVFGRFIKNYPEISILLNAYYEKQYLGGLMSWRDSKSAYANYFVVMPKPLKKLSNLSLAPIMFWNAMCWAKEQGCAYFDVSGFIPDSAPSDRLYFVHKYKAAFNPHPADYMGYYIYTCSPVISVICETYTNFMRILKIPYKMRYRLSRNKKVKNKSITTSVRTEK